MAAAVRVLDLTVPQLQKAQRALTVLMAYLRTAAVRSAAPLQEQSQQPLDPTVLTALS